MTSEDIRFSRTGMKTSWDIRTPSSDMNISEGSKQLHEMTSEGIRVSSNDMRRLVMLTDFQAVPSREQKTY